MVASIKEEVLMRGYAFIEGLDPDKGSVEIAIALGQVMTPKKGGLVHQLTPRAMATPNTYSGIYGLDRFPFHTDLAHLHEPPRYLMLRCVRGYADVPTLLIDSGVLLEKITVDVLSRALVRPRRPQGGTFPLLRLYEAVNTGYLLRWDETFLKPASKIGDFAFQRMLDCLAQIAPQPISLRLQADTLLIDNWRMLHARSPIPLGREDRQIERIYLESLN